MTTATPPVTIRERLLSEAVRRRELAASALPAVRDLLAHGVSFEQALVGTGLISAETFGVWMANASGLPVLTSVHEERSFPPGLEAETVRAWCIVPQAQDKKRWTIGLTDPWDTDVRSALEALAVEHAWTVDFAYVPFSIADQWLREADDARRSADALARYARSLVERVERERVLKLVSSFHPTHPKESALRVPDAWFPALRLRLLRRASRGSFDVTHTRSSRASRIELRATKTQKHTLETEQAEHPVHDWTDALKLYLEEGKLVFVLDTQGVAADRWTEDHAPYETEAWRTTGRWVAPSDSSHQEALFHLALAGYPGTVCFRSAEDLRRWERAAEHAHVAYAACIGHPTDHGVAWSLYTV